MIPSYPVACLGHMISSGRRAAVTRPFSVSSRSVYFHLLFHCEYFPYLVLVFVFKFNCSLGNRYFWRCMLEHTKRQVHNWEILQHALSRYVYNRSLFDIFIQVERRSLEKKSGLQRDSNPWPPRYRSDALPTELWSHTLGASSRRMPIIYLQFLDLSYYLALFK